MKGFAELFEAVDQTTRTNEKVAALVSYFRSAPASDAAWAVHFLSGNRPKRLVGARKLAAWAVEVAGVPEWLFEECYHAVGDLAETIALLLPPAASTSDLSLTQWIEDRLLRLSGEAEDVQRAEVVRAWSELDGTARLLWTKLLTGGFRVGVSRTLVVRALSQASDVPESAVAHRLMGDWEPSGDAFNRLLQADTDDASHARPYPFYLAHPLEDEIESLGNVDDWLAEWKWDGIRSQVIRRRGETFIWSRGEQALSDRFPELAAASTRLPDGTVLDGEILPWMADAPLPFAQLQRRIGRLKLGPKILAEVPVVVVVYDLLELDGRDMRSLPLRERRSSLADLLERHGGTHFRLSPAVPLETWADARAAQQDARRIGAEGLMLKPLDSVYGVGRKRGGWWKWKVQPFTVDAVLIYAQAGHGRRASLFTDYTFAVWRDGELVPFAKAYSGLTDAEIRRLDTWIRANTLEKFGPVRSVTPFHVFEIGFEGIQASTRHKSGVAVRFPRILRWRTDKKPQDADGLDALRALIAMQERS
ncbi:MAG TPA: ATP-dependent DNA ligase [Longimicrobiales bacterium]